MKTQTMRNLSVIIFLAGFLLGMVMAAIPIWGGLEASMFDPSFAGEAHLPTVRCPVMITGTEQAMVSASFTNPTERDLNILIRAHIANGYVSWMRESDTVLSLSPGETRRLEWEVSADDRVFGRLILLRIHALRNPAFPYRQAACGIMVVNSPYLSGNQIYVLGLFTSLALMGAGIYLWRANNRPLNRPLEGRARESAISMFVLLGIVVAGVVAGLLGRWLIGILIIVFSLILLGGMLEHFFRSPSGSG